MLYLVSGASRSGKTIIAKRIFQQLQVPYLSLDWLVMGFTNGVPEYGIHDKLFPDEIAERLWSFLQAMCASMLWAEVDCVIEGEAILPEHIRELMDRYPDKIRICFVGYTDVDREQKRRDIRTFSDGKGDWLVNEPEEHIHRHIENMVNHSRMIKSACETCNLAYFDTSHDFSAAIEAAIAYLVGAPDPQP